VVVRECEGEADETDAGAVAEGETPITPTQAGTQSAALPRRRTAVQKARAPLSTKPQDLQVRFRRISRVHDSPVIHKNRATVQYKGPSIQRAHCSSRTPVQFTLIRLL